MISYSTKAKALQHSNYDKYPKVHVDGVACDSGYAGIVNTIVERMNTIKGAKGIIVVECYHGVFCGPLIDRLVEKFPGILCIDISTAYLDMAQIDDMVQPCVTNDPVFGFMSGHTVTDFMSTEKLTGISSDVATSKGIVCIFGTGASLACPDPDLLIYADMPRVEIQRRFRHNQLPNLGSDNAQDDFAYKYKRAFFVDWRVCDRLKKELIGRWDFVLDTTRQDDPVMLDAANYRHAMAMAVRRPLRLVPFFDPGPWGGQWLKDKFDLEKDSINYAWGFDCVPEENTIMFRFDDACMEVPAINLVFMHSIELLGEAVFDYFGAEFPIRFDFLDTMEGGNLSLQVHPLKSYIRDKFGMAYTQDESYYIMDAKPNAIAYLGMRDDANVEHMLECLEKANTTDGDFNAEEFVARWPVKKHDHLLIPAGTIHCSGADTVVLEISATPYIFTFKLWDWGRLDLDGKQRPISLEHGRNVLQNETNQSYVRKNLINHFEKVSQGPGWMEERTGLHKGHFIETKRHVFTDIVPHDTHGSVNVINLVEGEEVIIESPGKRFEPFHLHYAETVVIPAMIGAYTVRPVHHEEVSRCITIKASIRIENLHKSN